MPTRVRQNSSLQLRETKSAAGPTKTAKFGNEQWPTRRLHGNGNRDSPVHDITKERTPYGLK